jgi:tRNA(fMet)-specific endonuclease VapC
MLDTNICIYIIKKKPAYVIKRFQKARISNIGISSITLSELVYGALKSSKPEQNHLALAQFAAPLEILAYDHNASQYYGDVRCHLEKQGTPIGALDMLIAAHALSTGCILVTNNEKEFNRVPNIKIENWTQWFFSIDNVFFYRRRAAQNRSFRQAGSTLPGMPPFSGLSQKDRSISEPVFYPPISGKKRSTFFIMR